MLLAIAAVLLTAPSAACFTHEPTRVTFAAAPRGFQCSGPRHIAPGPSDVSLAYRAAGPGHSLTVSAYVYEKKLPCCSPDATVEEHLADVKAEIRRRYTGLECEAWSVPGHPAMSGLRCHGRSLELGPGTYVTYIGLQELSGWWLKVRVTARLDEQKASEEALEVLLPGITLPVKAPPSEPPVLIVP